MLGRKVLILLKLLAGHFLCDYPLQGDFIGKFKNRHVQRETFAQNVKQGGIPWWHLMTAHAFIHSGAVLLITNSMELTVFELVAHFWIDVAKCEGYTDINTDQLLHVACKVGYVIWLSM